MTIPMRIGCSIATHRDNMGNLMRAPIAFGRVRIPMATPVLDPMDNGV